LGLRRCDSRSERFSDDGDDLNNDDRRSRDDDEYDSGVNTDMSLVTVAPTSPAPYPLKRSASTKILQIINILQQEAYKYDLVLTNNYSLLTRLFNLSTTNKLARSPYVT
jgi:hypothetical protein